MKFKNKNYIIFQDIEMEYEQKKKTRSFLKNLTNVPRLCNR